MKLFWSFWAVILLLVISVFGLALPEQLAEISRVAAEFDTDHAYLLAGFYLVLIFVVLFCLFTLLHMLRPRKKKGILLHKDKKISVTLDERNIKKIIHSFFKQFPEIKLSKIWVKNRKNQVDLDIDLLILPTYNVPQLADSLKEKTLSFLKDLYAREILNNINFNIMVDEKQLDGMISRGEKLSQLTEENLQEEEKVEEESTSVSDEEKIEEE